MFVLVIDGHVRTFTHMTTTQTPSPRRSRKLSPREALARSARSREDALGRLWIAALAKSAGEAVDGEAVVADLERAELSIDRWEEWCAEAAHRSRLMAVAKQRPEAEAAFRAAAEKKAAADAEAEGLREQAQNVAFAAISDFAEAKSRALEARTAESRLQSSVPPELAERRDDLRRVANRSANESRCAEQDLNGKLDDLKSFRDGVDHLRAQGWSDERLVDHVKSIEIRERDISLVKLRLGKLREVAERDAAALAREEARLAAILAGRLPDEGREADCGA